MDSIPKDQETRQKIVDIINHQFDLEIYLKQREVATIRNEITKAEHVLQDLKLAVEHESMAASLPESAHYTRRSAMYFQGGSQALLQQSASALVPRRKTYRTSEKTKLYGRRNDGVFVSLACPVCLRDDLLNLQGFLNHCRISHNLEFGPYEQVMLQCGTPVDESEVPMDNPARLRPVMNFTPSASKPQKKLERPSIKVFEEDVDMELENERKSSLQAAAASIEDQETIEPSTPVEETSTPTVNTPTTQSTTSTQVQPTASKDVASTTVIETAHTSDEIHVPPQAADETSKDKEKEKEQEEEANPNTPQEPPAPKIESFAAAMSFGTASDIGSRFYIKRRILVGNVSKFISPERRDPALKQFTHKWMIYVVEPPQSKQPVGAFITCVRFHLHPSYKPNDVVDVTEPPFKLTRFGWGEFPIRIQLFFVDKKRNKAVDLIHHLKLDNSHSGKQLLGGERSIEIELDRNTDFKDTTLSPAPVSAPQTSAAASTPAAQQDPSTSTAAAPPAAAPQRTPQEIQQQQQKEQEALQAMAVKQKMSLLNGILKESVRRLPIVRAGSHGTVLPYSCATSSKQFFEWSVGKRKALEWHRARLLRLETQKRALKVNEQVLLRLAAKALTTKDAVLWCRSNKYTPIQSDTIEDVRASDLPPGYCKFCGSVRDGHDETIDDHCPRRPKGWNSSRKRGGINSTTSVSQLLGQLEAGWDHVLSEKEDDDMDIDVDMDDAHPQHPHTNSAAQTDRRKDMLQRIEACALDEDSMDVAHERSLDWIWSVVGQLRLKSVIANDMLLAKDGNLQGPTSSFDLGSAMKQRLVVGNLLAQTTRVFLNKLVRDTVNTCRKEEQGSADKSTKMMVPYHVYQAAQQKQEFDFLTNQYMGPEES